MQRVGVVRTVARYPVKSMRGEAYASLPLTLQGFDEDRRFAFVQAESRSDFPWLTARQMPELLLWQTSVENPGTPDVAVTVTTAAGERWPVASIELRQAIEKRFGKPVFLLRDHRGSFDVANVSLISQQTVERIAEESQTEANPWRFRPSLLVSLEGGAAFDELKWVGRILRLGDKARIAAIKVDQRCVIPSLDPATGESAPQILKCIVQQHDNCAGVYATVLTRGEVRTGDGVHLED
ncbi:MAG TPA: MOSC N-terminal beta barrel domain-containing protein [Terriglobia bacterium]|nr:MOSC N-terminal beta barrel domain-containing protein [Terriglobia bacterium]